MALPTLDATFASSVDLPRRQMLAKWLVEELGETQDPSNVFVSGAGSSAVNGLYIEAGVVGGKKFYDRQSGAYTIAWNNTNWEIRTILGSVVIYISNNNVEFPWQVTAWITVNGSAPVPSVSESPSPSPISNYYDLPERYLWAKIAVAAGAPRSEADYISLPKQHVWKAIYDVVSGSSLGTIDWSEKQALGHIAAAYRGDTGDAGALATYIDWPWRYQVASIIGGAGTPVVPFAPTDIPNIRVWFDANENVKSFAGNNFTDEIASFAITGSIYSEDNGTYNVDYTEGLINGRNRYRYNNGGGEAGSNYGLVYWNGTQWVYELWEVPSDGDPGVVRTNYGTGNTTYPWNATWSMGTFTRTPTTVDISATNNQSVVKWYNRVVAGGPVIQNTLAAQPIYETNVYGKKVLSFNADSISGNGAASANWGSEYSVYCVATNLGGSTSFNGAFATSHSTITSQRRGALGGSTTGGVLAFTNGTQRNSTLSVSTATFAVWSYRFTTSGGSVALGKNKTFESLAGAGSSPSPFTNFMIGTAGGSNSSITKIGEIIGYSGNHNEATANQIIDYLAAKWGIAL